MAKDESKIKQSWKYVDIDDLPIKSRSFKAQIEEIERESQTQANKLESEYRSVLSSGDTEKAIELLIELIYADNNTQKRRKELRELYSKQCPAGEDATEYSYLRVMEVRWGVNESKKDNPIKGAKRDYINYLQLQAQKYDYNKDFDDDAVRLAKKITKLLKELLEELLKSLLEENPDTPKNDLIQWLARSTNYDRAQEILKNSNENDLIRDLIQWLTRSTDYDSAWEILKNSNEDDLIQFAVKAFQSEYDKYKKRGNTADKAFLRATWILASLFKKTGDTSQAIPKFIECKDFRSAYELVDIHSVESIRFALEEFKGHDDNHVKALSLMINRHADLEQMYTVKKLPDNFAMKWFWLSLPYGIYRVRSLFGSAAALAIIAFLIFFMPYVAPSHEFAFDLMIAIAALILCNDIRLYGKWISLHQMYANIIATVGDHPQMSTLKGKFWKTISSERNTRRKLIIILFIFLLYIWMFHQSALENKSATIQPTPTVQESVVSAKNQPATETETPRDEKLVAPPTKIVTAEDTSYLNARTDLSLNGIDLGISVAEAQSKLGQPVKVEHLDNHDRQYYSDGFYISVANNKVTALVTKDPKFKTRRGLHVGSTYDEIIDKYGTNSADMTVDNLTLHEYPFTAINGENALLRFAVDSSNRVDYISIRVVDPPAPRENTDSKGQYVGTYNSGMKAYIVPGTLKISSDRNSCNVRILAEGDAGDITYLDYRIWREGNSLHFSNSEGYSGVITSNMTVENNIWKVVQQ